MNEPIDVKDAHEKGTMTKIESCPTVSLFGVPQDDSLTLRRCNCETSRVTKSPDNATTHAHALSTNEKLNHAVLPEGKSR